VEDYSTVSCSSQV